MPAKKGASNAAKGKKDASSSASSVPSKRKAQSSSSETPKKVQRRSPRGQPAKAVDPAALIKFLLSDDVLQFCRPHDEIEDIEKHEGKEYKTYLSGAGEFTPFEELMCAVILSRPISHRLGMRSIRTLLNDPYNFTTPSAIKKAGLEGVRKALDLARTQHRQKTAEELVRLADVSAEKFGSDQQSTSLSKLYDSGDDDKIRATLKAEVHGLGPTGIDIFMRRHQTGPTSDFSPFVDKRTADALEKLGLPSSGSELKKLVDSEVGNGEAKDKKMKAFVIVMERALSAVLEKNDEGLVGAV